MGIIKKIRHFIGDCIRFFRATKQMLSYHLYRNITLPAKFLIKKYFPGVKIRTSGSDVKSYRAICLAAATDENVFNTFRVHRDYGYNLGEWKDDTRKIVLDIIKKDYPDLLRYTQKFQESEKFGGPDLHTTDIGVFSDPTLRYIKTLGDMKKIFGSFDGYDVVEIGAGYGGQCKIISDVFAVTSYTLVDLPEVLALDKKFLTKLQVKNVNYLPPDQISPTVSSDLIVSNFAFAECERFIQQEYIDKILKYAKRGYIIYNFDGHSSQDYNPIRPYFKEEIIGILSKYHTLTILEDYPHPDHCNPFILVWDDTKNPVIT